MCGQIKTNKMKKERYILMLGDNEIGRATSIEQVASLIGCTRVHIYQRLKEGYFTYKKQTYQLIDKLD